MTVQPRLAATVMLLRDKYNAPEEQGGIEVFMVRRVVQSEFMPDLYVFPGGSVVPDDSFLERQAGTCMDTPLAVVDPTGRTALGHGLRAAAARELFEEANVLLAYQSSHIGQILAISEDTASRFFAHRQALNERTSTLSTITQSEQLVLATDRLTYFAHWITPEGMPKRFDTHFFLAAAPPQQEALYDKLETSEGVWFQPDEVIARLQQGEQLIAFPTFHQLNALTAFTSVAQALAIASSTYVPTHQPLFEQKEGKSYVYLPEDPTQRWQL